MKIGNDKNSLGKQNLEANHKFNFKDYKMLVNMHNKQHRKIVEFNIIFLNNNYILDSSFSTSFNLLI